MRYASKATRQAKITSGYCNLMENTSSSEQGIELQILFIKTYILWYYYGIFAQRICWLSLVRAASMKVTDHIGIGADGGSAFVCIMGQGSYAVYIYGDPS